MDTILVTVTGILAICFTYWFFLMKRSKEVQVSGEIEVVVDGGYSPEIIVLPKGRTTKIHFLRKDPSSCLEEVMIPDFKIRKQLELNKRTTVELTPQQSGEFPYSCGMNMFHGKIKVQ